MAGVMFEWLGVGGGIDAVASALLRNLLAGEPAPATPLANSIVEIVPVGLNQSDAWVQRTSLDGREYTFQFNWNDRSAAWFLTIYDTDEEPLVESRKIVTNQNLLNAVLGTNLPSGVIVCLEASGDYTEPTRESLGSLHRLCYVT